MNNLAKKQAINQKFFDENRDIWLQDATYSRKFVVISGKQIKAVYDRGGDAYHYAMDNFQPGEFIVQQVISAEEAMAYILSIY